MDSKPTTTELAFAADITARDAQLTAYCKEQGFTDKRSGWTSYRPEQVAHLNPPTNEERSRAEVIRFRADPPAGVYVGYLSADRAYITTWTGDKLARVTAFLSRRAPRNWHLTDERGTFTACGIDGRTYKGTHYGAGMYCRMKAA